MKGWIEINIGSIGQVVTGNTPLTSDKEFYGGIHQFIKPTDMDIDRRHVTKWEENYSEKAFKKYKNSYIPKGSTGVVTIGTVGEKIFQADRPCFTNQSVNVVIPNQEKFDNDFIFYLLKYNLPKVSSANPGTASGRHHVSKSNFCSIKVSVPKEKSIQKKIGEILSSYDKFIENNLKRINLLEEFAQRTYEEWFVKFRVNGEHLPLDEKTGLPVGWETKKITNCKSFKQHKEKVKKFDGELIYLATADVDGTQITGIGESVTWKNKPSRAQIKLLNESVWFARMSKTYKVIIVTSNFNNQYIISSGFAGFIPKNSYCLPFLFYLINSKDFHDKKNLFATGATQVSLNNISLGKIEITEPALNFVELFGKKFIKTLEIRQNLINQNQKLKESRDILLPKLMNGTINVE